MDILKIIAIKLIILLVFFLANFIAGLLVSIFSPSWLNVRWAFKMAVTYLVCLFAYILFSLFLAFSWLWNIELSVNWAWFLKILSYTITLSISMYCLIKYLDFEAFPAFLIWFLHSIFVFILLWFLLIFLN